MFIDGDRPTDWDEESDRTPTLDMDSGFSAEDIETARKARERIAAKEAEDLAAALQLGAEAVGIARPTNPKLGRTMKPTALTKHPDDEEKSDD